MKKTDSQDNNSGYKDELKKFSTLKDLTIYGIAFMTPIAPAYIYGRGITINWRNAGIGISVCNDSNAFTAYSYGRMAAAFPVAGSTYTYTQRAISPYLGF